MKSKRVISLLLACMVFVSSAMITMQAPIVASAAKSVSQLKKELEETQKKRTQNNKEKQKMQTELKGVLAAKTQIEEQMMGLQNDIEQINSVISDKEVEIKNKETQIKELSVKIEDTDERLKDRMKVMYENGTTSYLEIILDAKGLSDLFTRVSIVNDIVKHDKNLINTYVDAKETVEHAKNVVEVEKAENEEAKGLLVDKKSDLKVKTNEKKKLVADLEANIEEKEKLVEEGEKQQDIVRQELAKALAAQEAAAKKKSGSSGSTAPAKVSSGDFCWPSAASTRVTSEYGYRIHPISKQKKLHKGMDIGAAYGTNVLAAADGVVVTAGWNAGGYGNYVTINHGGGVVTLYGHNSSLVVSAGQTVKKGQVIAKVGSTGNSTGNHIHFEVIVNGSTVNPKNYL